MKIYTLIIHNGYVEDSSVYAMILHNEIGFPTLESALKNLSKSIIEGFEYNINIGYDKDGFKTRVKNPCCKLLLKKRNKEKVYCSKCGSKIYKNDTSLEYYVVEDYMLRFLCSNLNDLANCYETLEYNGWSFGATLFSNNYPKHNLFNKGATVLIHERGEELLAKAYLDELNMYVAEDSPWNLQTQSTILGNKKIKYYD